MFCNLQNSQCKSSVAAAVRKKMAPKRICLIGAGPSGMSVLYQLERLRKEGVAGPLEVSGFWCVKFQPFIHVMSNRVQLLLSSIKMRKCCCHLTNFLICACDLLVNFTKFKNKHEYSSSRHKSQHVSTYFKTNLTGKNREKSRFWFSCFLLLKSY